LVVLFAVYFDVEVLHAPFQSLLMGVKEYVKTVSANGTPPVENFYGLAVFVAGDNHFGAERVSFVSGYKGVTRAYFVPTGRYTIRKYAATLSARAICGYTHLYGFPFTRLPRGSRGICIAFDDTFGIDEVVICGAVWPSLLGPGLRSRFTQSRSDESICPGDSGVE